MAKRTWTVELPVILSSAAEGSVLDVPWTRTHTIELEHSYWPGKRKVHLDGRLLQPEELRSFGIFGFGSDDLFMVDGHSCIVHIRSNGIVYKYHLLVDGISMQTGEEGEVYAQVLEVEPGASDKMPNWAWLFILLCPVVTFLGLFLGINVVAMVAQIRPATTIFYSALLTPLMLHAIVSVISTSKGAGQDTRSRAQKCVFIVVRTGVLAAIVAAVLASIFRQS